MAHSPNANEDYLLKQIYSGQPAILPETKVLPETRAIIDAQYLREHILEISSTASSGTPRRAVRWVIHNAIFEEQLDLQDGCRSGGGSLPALEFVNCEFKAGFYADGAKIERLKFKGCVFMANENVEGVGLTVAPGNADRGESPAEEKQQRAEADTGKGAIQQDEKPVEDKTPRNRISLRNCRIETELCLEGLTPHDFDGKPGILIVDAFAATVGTNVMVRNTTLRALRGESAATLLEAPYALDLSTADVGSDVQLMPCVVLEGGLKMRDARVGGTLWCAGLQVTDGENESSRAMIVNQDDKRLGVKLDTTEVQGNVVLSIDDTKLQQAFREVHRKQSGKDEAKEEIAEAGGKDATTAKKDYERFDWRPFRFQSIGEVSLRNTKVGGDLYLSASRVVGDLTLLNLNVHGCISAGRWPFEGSPQDEMKKAQNGAELPPLLELGDILVEGDICLNNCRIGSDCDVSADANQITLSGSVLEGMAIFKGKVREFNSSGVTVAGDLTVACERMVKCDLAGVKVAGKLDLTRAAFRDEKGTLYLQDAEVKHSIDFAARVPRPLGLQRTKLKCYPKFSLIELLLPASAKGNIPERIACFLMSDKERKYKPILLNGKSEPLHNLNDGILMLWNKDGSDEKLERIKSPLSLDTLDEARQYLRLFCAFVWGPRGSFSLLTSYEDLPKEMKVEEDLLKIKGEEKRGKERVWEMQAYVRYSNSAFRASFHLPEKTGRVEMADDQLLGSYGGTDADVLSKFEEPYRLVPKTGPLAAEDTPKKYRSDFNGWIQLPTEEQGREREIERFEREASMRWVTLLNLNLKGLANVAVDLTSASCRKLNDNAAQVWKVAGNVKLEDFGYQEVSIPNGSELEEEIKARLDWVRSGIEKPESKLIAVYFFLTLVGLPLFPLVVLWWWLRFKWKKPEMSASIPQFRAQPYAHLAQVLRERGDDGMAREVEAEKMWQAAVDRARFTLKGKLSQIYGWRPYGVMFRYGLSPLRAAISVLAIWSLGSLCVWILSDNQMLQANVTKVAPAALVEGGQPVMIVPAGTRGVPPVNVACGGAIEPVLDSFELITPILNLHQVSRCEIRSKPAGENSLKICNYELPVPAIFTHAVVWEYGEALYMLVGTIISSLALLTFSGIARRWEH